MKKAALLAAALLVGASPAFAGRIDAALSDDAITVTEDGKTALVYRTKPLDPAKEPGRANYVHPLYVPDGTVLTEDRPADHLHQRGAFWSWHQVLVNGKSVGDGWFMQGLSFHVHDRGFEGDAAGRGIVTIKADWLVNSGPEVVYAAAETTKVTVHPLKGGARRIDFDTTITARTDTLALGGSDDAKGYGGFSIRLIRPDALVFGSGGKQVKPQNEPVEAGKAMGFAWSSAASGSGVPAWTVGLSCKANDKPVTRWILRNELSMQNCVFPGRAPYVIKKGESLRLQETLIIRPASKRAPKPAAAPAPKP
ncbi:hypothetical protein DMC25_13590 [Caulobacter sp. D4A]|uniref:DUF6807 family protein n=1 Tax=unclassified Caulobacter TaxID=2648921 RepID=UPI000D72A8B8|nr:MULTISPECIES: DUF6807 family protein [unclassified Caulobacter]PXA86680.1 hypothetical protein DMC25_13590 [Caulobacter sp. D4A]PXA88526.1 hypothetical protein DMC18_19130 [Caulobacter sp. D5]